MPEMSFRCPRGGRAGSAGGCAEEGLAFGTELHLFDEVTVGRTKEAGGWMGRLGLFALAQKVLPEGANSQVEYRI